MAKLYFLDKKQQIFTAHMGVEKKIMHLQSVKIDTLLIGTFSRQVIIGC